MGQQAGTQINHAVNDDEECSAPIQLAQARNQLLFKTVLQLIELTWDLQRFLPWPIPISMSGVSSSG
jgi:hypothetical protein